MELLLVGVVTCTRVVSGQLGVLVCLLCVSSVQSYLRPRRRHFCKFTATKAVNCSALLFVHNCCLYSIETSFKNAQKLIFFSSILNKL